MAHPREEIVMPRISRQFTLVNGAATLFFMVAMGVAYADKPGWVDLLASGDLSSHWTTTGNWKLEDGIVSLTPRPGEKGWQRYDAYLWSKKQYKDFEADFEYKVQKSGN